MEAINTPLCGPMSSLDRGDAPAQIIIDKTTRSMAKRRAEETKYELDKIHNRIDMTMAAFELNEKLMEENKATYFVPDLIELERIISDTIQKKKYQQQVMVFVVGFESNVTTRVKLLSQINEFFNSYSTNFEEEMNAQTHESELEELSKRVQDALETADMASKRLHDINQEMVRYVLSMGEGKAASKSKKKLEKALVQAKEDIMRLTDKLLGAQTEIEEKEDQMTKLYRHIDVKTLEIQRFKQAADIARKNLNEVEVLKERVQDKEAEIQQLQRQISDLQLSLQQIEHTREHTIAKLKANNEQQEMSINKLEIKLSASQVLLEDARKDLQEQHDFEIQRIIKEHEDEVEKIKQDYTEKIEQVENTVLNRVRNWASDSEDDQESFFVSRQSTNPSQEHTGSNLQVKKVSLKSSLKPSTPKEGSMKSLQLKDSEGSKSSIPKKVSQNKSNLEPVSEIPFEGKFALEDEQKWVQVLPEQLPSAFKYYRRESLMVIRGLSNELKSVKEDHQVKVKKLRSQLIDRQQKWDAERQVLTVQVEQAQKLQLDAEKEADGAMAQLEDIINEQSKIIEQAEKIETGNLLSVPKEEMSTISVQTDFETNADYSGKKEDQKVAVSVDASADSVSIQLNSREVTVIDSISVSQLATGNASEYDIERPLSASSQRSMYEKYRAEMEQRKADMVDRRSKSTSMQSSLHNSRPLTATSATQSISGVPADNEGAVLKMNVATSPHAISSSVLSKLSKENSIISDYLKTYNFINEFKESLTQLFSDKEIMSASAQLSDLKMMSFSDESNIQNQIQEMTMNTHHFFQEATYIINTVFHSGYEPAVSSLLSRGETLRSILPPMSSKSTSMDQEKSNFIMEREVSMPIAEANEQVKELKLVNDQLKKECQQQKEQYEEKLNHNTVVMMEMQDMIQDLQRELVALNGSSKAISRASMYDVEQTIIFSRLDFERNQKNLKRAVRSEKISAENYNEVVNTMNEYVKIPKQRLVHLVKKYTHHINMKAIEANVRNSGVLDDEVFNLLERMEALQSKRAQRWGQDMDKMAEERVILANILMETLSLIEEESGIFMIKPILSWKGRGWVSSYPRKVTSRDEDKGTLNTIVTSLRNCTPFNLAPAPTPASFHRIKSGRPFSQGCETNRFTSDIAVPENTKDVAVTGEMLTILGNKSQQPMWDMSSSLPITVGNHGDTSGNLPLIHTPKLLELDFNRLLIGQNTVSATTKGILSTDRFANASNSSVRSYVSVPRIAKSQSGELRQRQPYSSGVASEQEKIAITEPRSITPPIMNNICRPNSSSRLSPVQPLPPIKVPSSSEGQHAITESDEEQGRPVTSESFQSHSKPMAYPSPHQTPPGSSMQHSKQSTYSEHDITEPKAPTPGHVTKITRSMSQSTTCTITPEGLF